MDRKFVRSHAKEVAALLGSKVVSHRRVILDLPECPYKVPFHTDDFWFTLLLSDCDYLFNGQHKRGLGHDARFCVSLKSPYRSMFARTHYSQLSSLLGTPVYGPAKQPEQAVSGYFLREPVASILRQIDFAPLRFVFLNCSQIEVHSEFIDPPKCVAQVRLFRELLLNIERHNFPNEPMAI